MKAGKLHSLTHEAGSVIDIERFNTTHKFYQVTAYVLKFIHMLKKRVTSPELTR